MKIFYHNFNLGDSVCHEVLFLRQVQPNDNARQMHDMWTDARERCLDLFEAITYSISVNKKNNSKTFNYQEALYTCDHGMRNAVRLHNLDKWEEFGGYFSPSGEIARTYLRHHVAMFILKPIMYNYDFLVNNHRAVDVNNVIKNLKTQLKITSEAALEDAIQGVENTFKSINTDFNGVSFNSMGRWAYDQKEKEDSAMKTEINIGVAIVAPQNKDNEIIKVIADAGKKVTVVKFADGNVEVVKYSKDDDYDVYVGVALAKARHEAGSNTAFHKAVDKLLVNVKPKVKKVKKPEPKKVEKEPSLKGPKGRKGIGTK